MVINGASRRNVGFWVKHLENDKKNDRADLKEVRGLAADNLADALREMQDDAQLTRCKNFMYQANFNPCEDEHLTEQQWERVFEIFEKHRGIPAGQPRVVYEHEKEGRIHRHVIWSRTDLEHMRAWPDGLDAKICHAAAREISEELGLQRTISPFDQDRDGPRPARAPKPYEMFRGLRSGLDPREITAEVTAIFRDSANAEEFAAGLHQHGYQLAQGTRRDFCILDSAGDVHSLARRLDGVSAKELRTFMNDFDRAALPTVEQAKAQHQERMADGRQADLATVQREIAWEEALGKAAIDKEKVERRFLAKEDIPKPPENLRGFAAEIWTAYYKTHNPNEFAELLEPKAHMACVTKEEADRSYREAAFAREIGRIAPAYREGEIVLVKEPGLLYRRYGEIVEAQRIFRLNERTMGQDQATIEKYLAPLDRKQFQGIDITKEKLNIRAAERAEHWQAIRLENAQLKRDDAPTLGKGIRIAPALGAADRAVGKALKVLDLVGSTLEGVLAPVLTPEQKREGARTQAERAADAAEKIDLSQYLADLEQRRQRQEREQEGAQKLQRGDRERG